MFWIDNLEGLFIGILFNVVYFDKNTFYSDVMNIVCKIYSKKYYSIQKKTNDSQ